MSEPIDRPKFRELRWEEHRTIPEQYDIVQLKMDGIFGCMKVSNGQWAIYSRTGKMKEDGVLEVVFLYLLELGLRVRFFGMLLVLYQLQMVFLEVLSLPFLQCYLMVTLIQILMILY